jgi:hypothetical protein
MWITVATVNENVNMELAIQQLMDAAADRDALLAEGIETGGHMLAPYDTQAAAMAAFGPGVVYKRAWNLESSARRVADFTNNHASKQISVVIEQQEV